MPTVPLAERERLLADFEASLAAEMSGLRTLQVALVNAKQSREILPLVSGWLDDWGEYHQRSTGPLLSKALRVALSDVSPSHLADAVWSLHRRSFVPDMDAATTADTTAPKAAPQAASSTLPLIEIPPQSGKYLPLKLLVDGTPMTVPACVADLLREAVTGRVRARRETMDKLAEVLPWAVANFTRDVDAKLVSNKAAFNVADALRVAITCRIT